MAARTAEMVAELMSPHVVVAPEARIASVMAWASLHEAEHVLVMQNNRLLGLASLRELGRAHPDECVFEHMSSAPLCVDPELAPVQAAALMEQRRTAAAPVVSEGRVLGIVTAEAVHDALDANPVMPGCENCGSQEDVRRDKWLVLSLCVYCRSQVRTRIAST